MKMSPTPTMLPPVIDSIYRKQKIKRESKDGPLYTLDDKKKKSNSLSSLIFNEDELDVGQMKESKSSSVMYIKCSNDDINVHNSKFRYSVNNHKKIVTSVFDYDRLLREEKKEFNFRLKNIPQPTGKFDDFMLLRKLGSGKFGKVYLVQDFIERKHYALKTIGKDVILRNSLEEDVEAERNYLYATNSPFIVSLIQHFEDSQRIYFVMEYLRNGNMYEHLELNGPFSEDVARFYIGQVVLALEYLHNVNLIYRDVKPDNMVIDANGYIKLVDFGFVKRVTSKTDTMIGTPAYLAPEMILRKSYDKTVDWWSLGVVIYEMLSGCEVTPFHDPNRMDMYVKITTKEVAFPPKFPRTTVRDLIKRLLKTNPSTRLGNGRNGSKEVKAHPWFASLKWNELYRRTLKPPTKVLMKYGNNNSNQLKVAALQQNLLGRNNNKLTPEAIQTRARFRRLMKMF